MVSHHRFHSSINGLVVSALTAGDKGILYLFNATERMPHREVFWRESSLSSLLLLSTLSVVLLLFLLSLLLSLDPAFQGHLKFGALGFILPGTYYYRVSATTGRLDLKKSKKKTVTG